MKKVRDLPAPPKIRLWLPFVFGLVFLSVGYYELQARLACPDILRFAETKAGEILKGRVAIGRIRYVFPMGMALKNIQVQPASESTPFSFHRIEKLVLGYGLLNLLRGDFKLPTVVRLDSPEIHFSSKRSPFPLLDFASSSSVSSPMELEIRQGEFHYLWNKKGRKWTLSHVAFKAKPNLQGKIQLELTAKIGGMAEGNIEIWGTTDPSFHHYELDVELKDVSFLPESQIPLKKIRGSFHLSEKEIQTNGLTSLFHGWDVQWRGRVEHWPSFRHPQLPAKPQVFMEIANRKRKSPFRFSVNMDFESEKLNGEGAWANSGTHAFHGKVSREGEKFIFFLPEFFHGYQAQGEFLPSNGRYDFSFEKERQRIQIHSNLSRPQFESEFQLDHVLMNHLDWVVLGRAHFEPLPKQGGDASPRYQARVQTDYAIVESEPLEDFQGGFELSSEGIYDLHFQWGGVFDLAGKILFKGGQPSEDLVLRVSGFNLESVQEFAGRPLSTPLKGILEGKLKLRGELKRPEVLGYFTLKDGRMDKLDFDHAVIQFQGFPPFFRLNDSKIFKGRNTVGLYGAIDLRLPNFLHGIRIKSPDNLILWKGMSVYWKEGESAIGGEKPLAKKIMMDFEIGAGADSHKEDPEETHVMAGPKLKF